MKSNNNITLLIEFVACLFLIILLSSSTVFRSVDIAVYLKEVSVFRFSTHSVFLIGNLIIIFIVVQSTNLIEKSTPVRTVQFNIADQQIKSSGPRLYIADENIESRPQFNTEDKNNTFTREDCSVLKQSNVPTSKVIEKMSVKTTSSSQIYRRTMSASYERGGAKVKRTVSKPELVRSKTMRLRTGEATTTTTLMAGMFDELNHDEFRRKIESFIEKQRRLIREELVVAGSGEHGLSIMR